MSVQLVSTGITFPDATTQTTAATGTVTTNGLRTRILSSGTTYTPAADVSAFWAFVFGATGGTKAASGWSGGSGGGGYSEKYYSAPSGSYTYSIGAAGAATGTAGGTTTFGVMTVTGSNGTTTATGTAGGAGSGGDYNATGGTGGNGVTGAGGGGGGGGSRAGNGGNGSAGVSTTPGSGGGTGGNNASGGTGGIAATTKAVGALTLPFGQQYEYFGVGYSSSVYGFPTAGATGFSTFDVIGVMTTIGYYQAGGLNSNTSVSYPATLNAIGSGLGGTQAAGGIGSPGIVIIVEKLK